MTTIDLNADLGEYANGAEQEMEREILAFVTSCNIACGGHTGDKTTMRATLAAARNAGVACGAHPSYPDREGFGRRTLTIEHGKLCKALAGQILDLMEIARELDVTLAHVKPHGALYNDAADDAALAGVIAGVITDIDPGLILVGLPDSEIHKAAKNAGLAFRGEAFVDRRYTPEGRLQPRREDGAVIEREEDRLAQALALAGGHPVTASDGSEITIKADTLCLHGDSPGALKTAEAVHNALSEQGYTLKAFDKEAG